jgi:hypothetical protein
MRNLTFHLPEYCGRMKIIGKPTKDCIDTEESAKELYEVLAQQSPGGMYSELEDNVVIEFLRRNLSLQTLREIEDIGDKKTITYLKGMDFYRLVQRVIKEKEAEARDNH